MFTTKKKILSKIHTTFNVSGIIVGMFHEKRTNLFYNRQRISKLLQNARVIHRKASNLYARFYFKSNWEHENQLPTRIWVRVYLPAISDVGRNFIYFPCRITVLYSLNLKISQERIALICDGIQIDGKCYQLLSSYIRNHSTNSRFCVVNKIFFFIHSAVHRAMYDKTAWKT